MEEINGARDPNAIFNSIVEIVQSVIRDPASFYRQMQRSGGFADPFVFAVAMGVAAGVVRAVLNLLVFGFAHFFTMVMIMLIITPILTGLFTFVSAAILFVIWRLLGSQQSYEVSFRCAAYALAIIPITAALYFIPYLGVVAGLAWTTYILVCASVEVHGTELKIAWIVFGVIFAILAIGSVSIQHSARSFRHKLENMGKGLGDIEKMPPEQAGQALGEFLKGMQKGIEKK
ncbi:MAG: YIP1 family protein [Syntrophobacteraceae bacterium]